LKCGFAYQGHTCCNQRSTGEPEDREAEISKR
jgi:hypothetical protein